MLTLRFLQDTELSSTRALPTPVLGTIGYDHRVKNSTFKEIREKVRILSRQLNATCILPIKLV